MKRLSLVSRWSRRFGLLVTLAVLGTFPLIFAGAAQADDAPVAATSRVRQPVALSFSPDGSRLFVANRRSGSISVIDARAGGVVAEIVVGRGLNDLAAMPNGRHLLAVDQAAGELLLLEYQGVEVRCVSRRQVGPDPLRVVIAPDGSSCIVSSGISRRLTFVMLAPALTVARSLELPFSPGNMTLLREGAKLVVADAFGGRLAVVDVRQGVLDSVRSLPAHNIRGLSVTPDGETLVIAHQTLRSTMKTDFEDVHWGRLMTSQLRSLQVAAVLSPSADEGLLRGGSVVNLGFPVEGASDPSALVCDRSGGVAVAIGGVGEVALSRHPSGLVRRISVGQRPVALAFPPEGTNVYIADAFDDSISVVDISTDRRTRVIALGPSPAPTLAERGERLFYDARLSHDGWMSCHSCHTDGHTNGRLADTQGDGSYGAPKLVPSLFGVGTTGPWAWNGSVARLEDQVRKSIERTMRGDLASDDQVEALTAFLRSLGPPAAVAGRSPSAEARGRAVFRDRQCASCHAAPDYTAPQLYNVGLADAMGNRRFNPPSLRGVDRRAPLLHDGRSSTLEDVFLKHRHPRGSEWTAEEVHDLAAFLKTL